MDDPPVRGVALDVVETCFSLERVADALEGVGAGRAALSLFFATLLRDGFALSGAADPRPFAEVADGALGAVAPHLDEDERAEVLGAFRTLDAHPDLAPALDRLAAVGVPAIALTNGSAEVTAGLLDRAGLAERVARVISVDEVGVWKPRPEPYLHAAETMGLPPEAMGLVAVHAWDVHGARRAGLRTGWVSRDGGAFPSTYAPADVVGPDLVAVVDGLLGDP